MSDTALSGPSSNFSYSFDNLLTPNQPSTARRPQKRRLTRSVRCDGCQHIFAVGAGKDLKHTSGLDCLVALRRHASFLLNELQAFVVVREDVARDVRGSTCSVLKDIDRDGDCTGFRSRSSGRKSREGDEGRESL